MTDMPIVLPDDDGIRPAGETDRCFYCDRKVGEQHEFDCVIPQRRIKVRYTFDFEIEVPFGWEEHTVLFHHNEGSWCATNAIDDLQRYADEIGGCLCNNFECTVLDMCNGQKPTRKNNKQEIVP